MGVKLSMCVKLVLWVSSYLYMCYASFMGVKLSLYVLSELYGR